jgi:hypothetical protein
MVRVGSAGDTERLITYYTVSCCVFIASAVRALFIASAVRASFWVGTVCADVVVFLALIAPGRHSDIFANVYYFTLDSNTFL